MACRSEIIPRNVSTQVSWLRNDINKDQIPRSVLRLFDNVYCLNQRTPVDNCWPKFATSRKFQQHWPPWAAQTPRVHDGVCGPLAASCHMPTRGRLGRFQKSLCLHQILKLYGSTANKYTQVDLNYGTYRRQNRRLKVVLARIMNAFIKYDARL